MTKDELKKELKKFKNDINSISFYLSKNGEKTYQKNKTDYTGKYMTSQEFIYKIIDKDNDVHYVLMIKEFEELKVESVLIGVYDNEPFVSETVFSLITAYKRDKDTFLIQLS